MKKVVRIALSLVLFASIFSVNLYANIIDDKPSISISKYDLLFLADAEKVMNFTKVKSLNERALEQIKLAEKSYLEGVEFLNQSNNVEAIASFKSAYKNYKRAKLSPDALNYPNLQLAVAYQLSDVERDNKKVTRYLDLVTKSIYKDKDWTYNIAILLFENKQEEKAAELLESVIKMDKFFFKAYGNLAAVYKKLGEDKKAVKVLSNLEYNQNVLAEKKRKKALADARNKEKEKNSKSGKPSEKVQLPEGIALDKNSLKVKDDAISILKNESIINFDERSRKKLKEGQEFFDSGAEMFNKGEYDLSIKAFKSAFKKFKQAKASEYTLSLINANLAMAYFMSPSERNNKKAMPIIDVLSKRIYDNRDWNYNLAIIHNYFGNKDKALSLLEKCTDIDKYFLLSYQNQIALHNDKQDLKKAKKVFKTHEKYKEELTEIYKEYVRTGLKQEGVDLSFLEGAIFRVFLGVFNEYYLPVDIYLHDDLIMVPLGDDYFNFISGNFENFKTAERYLNKISEKDDYVDSFIIAFKDGVRTDFKISE